MKTIKSVVLLAIFLGVGACGSAMAAPGGHGGWHGGHGGWHGGGGWRGGVGITFGGPLFWPPYGPYGAYGPYPYGYYLPPVVAIPAEPPTYIEQNPQGSNGPDQPWYFCPDPKGYYPYVKDCRVGWVQVAPQPPVNR